jgi:hypothetical protein
LTKENTDPEREDKVEEIMKDLATQIEINNKTMLVLFDERKEMILKLMAMVEEIHKIAVTQQEQNLILKAEIMRLRAKKGKKNVECS